MLKSIMLWAFLVAQMVKNLPAMKETSVQFLGWEDPLEKGQVTHSSILGLPLWLTCNAGKESTCSAGDLGSIPWLGRSPGEGKGYPLQYSGLENSRDCIVHVVTKSWTQLSHFQGTISCRILQLGAFFLSFFSKILNKSNLLYNKIDPNSFPPFWFSSHMFRASSGFILQSYECWSLGSLYDPRRCRPEQLQWEKIGETFIKDVWYSQSFLSFPNPYPHCYQDTGCTGLALLMITSCQSA